jgi:ABC-type glycerol-3-phosphate transport system permease component
LIYSCIFPQTLQGISVVMLVYLLCLWNKFIMQSFLNVKKEHGEYAPQSELACLFSDMEVMGSSTEMNVAYIMVCTLIYVSSPMIVFRSSLLEGCGMC